MEINKTERGFSLSKFLDLYETKCSIQKSSLATEDAIWLGVDDPQPCVLHGDAKKLGVQTEATCGWVPFPVPGEVHLTTRMHLSREQVSVLIPVLQRFVDTGEL